MLHADANRYPHASIAFLVTVLRFNGQEQGERRDDKAERREAEHHFKPPAVWREPAGHQHRGGKDGCRGADNIGGEQQTTAPRRMDQLALQRAE